MIQGRPPVTSDAPVQVITKWRRPYGVRRLDAAFDAPARHERHPTIRKRCQASAVQRSSSRSACRSLVRRQSEAATPLFLEAEPTPARGKRFARSQSGVAASLCHRTPHDAALPWRLEPLDACCPDVRSRADARRKSRSSESKPFSVPQSSNSAEWSGDVSRRSRRRRPRRRGAEGSGV